MAAKCYAKGRQNVLPDWKKKRSRSVLYLVVKGSELVREHAVFVHQETEASLLLQQSLFTAVCDEQLHVHLTARQRFQALATNIYRII